MNGNCVHDHSGGRAPSTDSRKMENLQNLHVALWLLKDCSWCELWKWTGVAMIAPTLFVAVWIAWHGRRCLPDLVHNVAVCLWISANVTWMFGEFSTTTELGTRYGVRRSLRQGFSQTSFDLRVVRIKQQRFMQADRTLLDTSSDAPPLRRIVNAAS
jgi:hypothetical protein